ALTVLPYLEQTFGVWTVSEGLAGLVGVLAARAAERGATFRYDMPAAGPALDGRRVAGVTLAGGDTVPADTVVWTAPARLLPDGIAVDRRGLFARRRDRDDAPPAAVRTVVTQ